MTNPTSEAAIFAPMTLHRLPLALLAAASLTLTAPLRAQDPDLRELLRDALYTEEVTRDPEAAAKQYEALLSKHDAQRAFAASALFRLAEVRRKQDRKDEAIALYQRLLREFPAAEAEAKLARENLAAMGEKLPASEIVAEDEEAKEIQRLEKLRTSSPDLLHDGSEISEAIRRSRHRVMEWLIDVARVDLTGEDAPLVSAAHYGDLEMVKLLLGKAKDQVIASAPEALARAVERKFIEVARHLLAIGTDPNWKPDACSWPSDPRGTSQYVGTPLMTAAFSGDLAMIDLLLNSKADATVRVETGYTALHFAAKISDPRAPRAIERLIELGADPNLLTNERERSGTVIELALSPLQIAIARENWDVAKALIRGGADLAQPGLLGSDPSMMKIRFLLENGAEAEQPRLLAKLIEHGPDAIPLIRELLESGCDPNDAVIPPIMRVFNWDLKSLKNANEMLAKHQKQVELIQLLLKHGADPNASYGTYTRGATSGPGWRHIAPGISPFVPESEKSEQLPATLLMKVVRLSDEQLMNNISLIQTLLDAGAKPTHEFPEVFAHVARGDDEALPIARALLPFRPETLVLDRTGYFLNWNPAVKRLVLDEVLNPAVAGKGGVHLAFADEGGYQLLVKAGAPIPPTAELLLANVASLTSRSGRYSGRRQEPVLTRVRRDAAGQWTREAIEWNGDAPLPGLAAGDIIEMSEKSIPTEKPQDQEFTDQVAWQFRKRISFPVTLEIGGKTRKIQLRGDLLVFDPTRAEAPLLSAGHLAGLFLAISEVSSPSFLKQDTLLTVRRDGSPEVRMDLSGRGAFEFALQSGDHLILPDPESVIDTSRGSSIPIQLKIAELGGARLFHPLSTTFFEEAPSWTMPSLIQVVTDAYASNWARSADQDLTSRFPDFSKRIQAGEIPVILPHPDFSRIRIKRNGETLETDFTAAIEGCTDDTTSMEARKSDVPLHPGDVVELLQKPGPPDQAWTGFTKEEERFFRKALGGVVMIRKQDGIIDPLEISYQQPAWQKTPHGLIPLAPASGVSSSRLKLLTGMEAWGFLLKRGGHELTVERVDLFIRDGDEIAVGGSVPQPATPSGTRAPRPRIVPPTPPSSR